jgi:light-regulated signal transduction histidine kinase (bacteriophytochrome)
VFGADGHPQYLLGISEDITDRKLAESQIKALNEKVEHRAAQLEAANKELESFSYSVSHDLRAPIRAISGFSKLLLQDHGAQLDQEARRKLDIVMSETRRMGTLIDDLLAFSRLGRQPMRIAELDMHGLVEGAYGRLSAQHPGAKVDFHLGILPDAMGDRALLEQVWVNLLSNALKFTSKRDKPQIEVGASNDGKEHVYFVRDNGAGFDPRYQSKLFGVFQRLHDAEDFPGTGVGLALVDRIVTRHGGRVWAESKPEEGATFYFTLPKAPVNAIG